MTSARLLIHRYRRPLAALCAALALLAALSVIRPPAPALVPVVVAAIDLPAGSTIGPGDVEIAQVPAEYAVPGSTSDAQAVVGRVLIGGISAGEPVSGSRILADGAGTSATPTVPVRLADPGTADLLVPGAIIDLVLPSGDTAGRIVAEGARVVTVPRPARETGFGASSRDAGSLVVVATDRRTAVALAAVATRTGLGVVIR